jgi:hypothetical protein
VQTKLGAPRMVATGRIDEQHVPRPHRPGDRLAQQWRDSQPEKPGMSLPDAAHDRVLDHPPAPHHRGRRSNARVAGTYPLAHTARAHVEADRSEHPRGHYVLQPGGPASRWLKADAAALSLLLPHGLDAAVRLNQALSPDHLDPACAITRFRRRRLTRSGCTIVA